MKTFTLLIYFLFVSTMSYSQIFTEDFSYPPGTLLTSTAVWKASSAGGTNALTVTAAGLTFPSYAGSGVGNACTIGTSGEDDSASFTRQDTGTTVSVYASFMLNVTTAQATGDYFFALSTSANAFVARVYAKSSGNGYVLGLTKSNEATVTYGTTVYNFGQTYLVVDKYTFVSGLLNDETRLYVFDTALPVSEPVTPTIGPVTSTSADAVNLSRVVLRQGSAANASTAIIDGIYLENTWIENIPNQLPVLIYPLNNSINNNTIVNFIWSKFDSSIYYILEISTDLSFNNIFYSDTIIIDTSKIVGGFQRDTKYFWRIKAVDTSGVSNSSFAWNFTTIPPLYTNMIMLIEGLYSPFFNLLMRKDSVNVYLRNVSPPYALADSVQGTIDSISFSSMLNFKNAFSGTYYLVIKHFNCVETWSKSGGEVLTADGITYNYDFTNSISQSYGNNLKLKGTKYCLYSGDVNQDGNIDLFDIVPIYNDATLFVIGNYLSTDLTADGIVDLTDLAIGNNNSTNFIRVRQP